MFPGLSSSDKYLIQQRELLQKSRSKKESSKHRKKKKRGRGGPPSSEEEEIPIVHQVSNTIDLPEVSGATSQQYN